MKQRIQQFVLALMVVLVLPTAAQDKKTPRVLVIGDAVYSQHARGVTAALKGKAEVVIAGWPEGVVANSTNALEHLDLLLGYADRNGKPVPPEKRPAWDMIHINVGLGDLIHCVPDLESFRVLPIHVGGEVATGQEQYRANLDRLIDQLKATKAEIVWASTTPIRHSRSNVFEMGSEIEYNAIAAEVMARHRVPINDMYDFVKHLINMDKPAGHGADPFNFDKKPIHMPIVREVERAFGLEAMPQTPEEQAVHEAQAEQGPSQG
ncbi:MAG: SGNH/GDSL hydrolase family protein [Planctomycetota bacterium]